MRQAPSFTSAFFRHFVRTCTGQLTAVNPGQSFSPTASRVGATSNGLPSIRPAVRGTDSNISLATELIVAATASNSNARPTAGSPGRPQSLFQPDLQTRRSMWTPTAISLSAEKGTPFPAFARALL